MEITKARMQTAGGSLITLRRQGKTTIQKCYHLGLTLRRTGQYTGLYCFAFAKKARTFVFTGGKRKGFSGGIQYRFSQNRICIVLSRVTRANIYWWIKMQVLFQFLLDGDHSECMFIFPIWEICLTYSKWLFVQPIECYRLHLMLRFTYLLSLVSENHLESCVLEILPYSLPNISFATETKNTELIYLVV